MTPGAAGVESGEGAGEGSGEGSEEVRELGSFMGSRVARETEHRQAGSFGRQGTSPPGARGVLAGRVCCSGGPGCVVVRWGLTNAALRETTGA